MVTFDIKWSWIQINENSVVMDTVYRRLATNQPEWVKGLYCIYIKVDTAAAVFVNRSSSDVRHDLIKISPFFSFSAYSAQCFIIVTCANLKISLLPEGFLPTQRTTTTVSNRWCRLTGDGIDGETVQGHEQSTSLVGGRGDSSWLAVWLTADLEFPKQNWQSD